MGWQRKCGRKARWRNKNIADVSFKCLAERLAKGQIGLEMVWRVNIRIKGENGL